MTDEYGYPFGIARLGDCSLDAGLIRMLQIIGLQLTCGAKEMHLILIGRNDHPRNILRI